MIDAMILFCLAAIALPFVAYPALLWLHARMAPVEILRDDSTPEVDLVIAAHDEAESIAARIENALTLDYPRERLHVWIASDGSQDDTVAIARRYAEQGVRVLDLPRGGKAAALVSAVEAGSAEILAFSDANSDWQPDALRALVRSFADPAVGGVAGDQRYVEGTEEAAGERSYWSFDRLLKRWQSRAGNAISATGAIHAIRRELFEAPPADATDDFMISTGVIARGRRLVFEEDAVALEPPAPATGSEYRRKVRITTRGLRAVLHRRALLDPRRTGLYALELAVHKVWRRQTWLPLLGLVALAPFATWPEAKLAFVAWGAAAATLIGAAGLAWPALLRSRPIALASYVVMVNAACARATVNVLRGERVSRWDSERADPLASGAAR